MVGETLSPLRFTILCGLMGMLGACSLQSQSLSSQRLQLTVEAGQDLEGFVGVALSDGSVVIEYTGTLKSASTVRGPYSAVAGASSPYSVAPTQAAEFYIAE